MNYNVLMPTFYKDFKCSGSACKYTCCSQWSIAVGKADYLRVKAMKPSAEMKALIDKSYKRNKKSLNDLQYANVILNDGNGYCNFLTKEGLCSLQLECGYDALCKTCQIFPRVLNIIDKTRLEYSLSLGCEEVVKLFFELKDGVCFENVVEPITKSLAVITNMAGSEEEIVKYYWDIKTMSISILQSQAYSLDDRMLVLGMAYRHIVELQKEDKYADIPAYADVMISSVNEGGLSDIFNSIELNSTVSVVEMTSQILMFKKSDQEGFTDRVLDGLGVSLEFSKNDDGSDDTSKVRVVCEQGKYDESCKLYNEFMAKYPRALENIMVSEFHNKTMPFFWTSSDIWDGYLYFVCLYNVFKKAMIGYIDPENEMESVIHAVTYIARIFTHSEGTKDYIIKQCRSGDIDDLAHLAVLIKG